MLVLLLSPLSLFDGSELLGAIPDGTFAVVPVPLDELDGVDAIPGVLPDDGEEEPIVDEGDVDAVPEPAPPLVAGAGVVVVDVVELVSVVGAAGGSDLLQAPSAAKVAARATHLIELRMFTPAIWGQYRRVRA